ncbi:MAG TPA: GFA family protein [Burkholderiaceae bacterium]|nr:GFA family protein [Burkholderiaceae bacterium]
MLVATCHCGAVRVELPRRPGSLTNCNCSICRRYGALWAYYKADTVRVSTPPDGLHDYAWGDRNLRFVRCATCGCVMYWEPIRRTPASRMGVNARNVAPEALGPVKIRRLDGASTWKYLDD